MITRRSALAGMASSAALLAGGPLARAAEGALPSNIVSVGGAITETIFALGAGSGVKAVDTTSTYPPAAFALPKVGYLRQLSAEGVLAMGPDLILLSEEAGPAAAVDQLKGAGLPVVQVPVGQTPAGVQGMISAVGAALDVEERAELLSQTVGQKFDALGATVDGVSSPTVLLILSAGTGPLLGAGRNTGAASIIELAGGVTALADMEGYKPVSLEPVLAADPDWIVFPAHVATALGGAGSLAALDVVAKSRAGREGRVAIIGSHYLLGFGPRAPEAAADLATLLHPDLDIPLVGRSQSPSELVSRLDAR